MSVMSSGLSGAIGYQATGVLPGSGVTVVKIVTYWLVSPYEL